MERTVRGSGRTRGGARGVRTRGGARGVRSRGGSGGARGMRGMRGGHDARGEGPASGEEICATTKGASNRPSLSEPLVLAMMEDISKGTGLETPSHAKKRRVLPTATVSNVNLSEWDSLDPESLGVYDAGSSSQQIESSESIFTTSPLPIEVVLEVPLPSSPVLDWIAGFTTGTMETGTGMPAFQYLEGNESATSTPRASIVRNANRALDFSAPDIMVPSPMEVSLAGSPVSIPAVESLASVSEAPSPALYVECGGSKTCTPRAARISRGAKRSLPYSRPLRDEEITEHLFYGSDESEEENDEENDKEGDTIPVSIPKSIRSLLQDESHDEAESSSAELSFAWPPESSTSGSAAPASVLPPVEQSAGPAPAQTTFPNIQPGNKFDFQWRAFTQPQIAPNLRREPFSQINCGPVSSYASPYDAFIDIWDRQIMETIVVETNRYAQQLAVMMIQLGTMCPNSRITKWHNTTVEELYVFFAIIIASGVVIKTRLEEYWNCSEDIFSTPHFKAAMTLDRFLLLSRCLHFQNNDNCNPSLLSRPQAKLYKVQPVLDHLNEKFSTLYVMDQNIALDDSLTMWKGWLDINQFIKNKAAAVGIKTYEVCESRTGYLWRFEVHAGHDEANRDVDGPVSGIVPSLVLGLLNGLEYRGHTLWMDNFYNSPALARELKSRGFDCVGTLRTNRQFVPVELTHLKKGDMAVGQVCGCTSGDVDIMVWRDKNRVALISTYHGLSTANCGDKLIPTAIADYNICMGGVDRKDQMLAMFPIERKRNTVWYKKLFRRLLNVSILNAYIL